MNFPKANGFDTALVQSKIMGPNPLKMCEELLEGHFIPRNALVMDLGSGTGITSALLACEYGFVVYAADLWSNPGENMRFFESLGLDGRQVIPVKADATDLPFATEFFDAVVSIDSYNYFGRDASYLEEKLLPFVKSGGYLYLAFPGMVKDCHGNLPAELLLSWTPEQMDFIHDMAWWRAIFFQVEGIEILSMRELACHEEAWADWLVCENDYARGDRAAMEAGAGKYLNTLGVVLRKK